MVTHQEHPFVFVSFFQEILSHVKAFLVVVNYAVELPVIDYGVVVPAAVLVDLADRIGAGLGWGEYGGVGLVGVEHC